MTYYSDLDLATNEIAGAVAMEVCHDLRASNFTFSGFPAIRVSKLSKGKFTVQICCGSKNEHKVSFSLPEKKAVAVVKGFRKRERQGGKFFRLVRDSLTDLEAKEESSR